MKLPNSLRISELVYVMVGNVGSIIVVIFGTKLLSFLMSVETYGQLSLLTTIFTAGSTLIYGPINSGITRYAAISISENKFISFSKEADKILSFVAQIIGCAIILGIALFHKTDMPINILFIGIFVILSGYNIYFSSIQLILRKRVIHAFTSVLNKVLYYLVPSILLYFFYDSSSIVLIGYSISALILFSVQHLINQSLKKEIVSNFHQNLEKSEYSSLILIFAKPFVIWGILQSIQFASERWIISLYFDLKQVAYYTAINQVGFQTVTIGFGVLSTLFIPILFKRAGTGTKLEILDSIKINNKITIFLLFICLSFLPVVIIFSENIMNFFIDKKLNVAFSLLPYVFLSAILFNIAQFIGNNFSISLNPSSLLLPKIIMLAISILLYFILGRKNGIVGIVTGNLISSIVYFCWMCVLNFLLTRKYAYSL